MKVLNLRCGEGHSFEGWFGSESDFQSQTERSLIECPMCANTAIERLPSAPRLNVANMRDAPRAPVPDTQNRWLHTVRRMIENTEDVGERFPEEARRIHYGEAQERGIRGQASREDADALREEGIDVVSVPLPAAFKGPVQ